MNCENCKKITGGFCGNHLTITKIPISEQTFVFYYPKPITFTPIEKTYPKNCQNWHKSAAQMCPCNCHKKECLTMGCNVE